MPVNTRSFVPGVAISAIRQSAGRTGAVSRLYPTFAPKLETPAWCARYVRGPGLLFRHAVADEAVMRRLIDLSRLGQQRIGQHQHLLRRLRRMRQGIRILS